MFVEQLCALGEAEQLCALGEAADDDDDDQYDNQHDAHSNRPLDLRSAMFRHSFVTSKHHTQHTSYSGHKMEKQNTTNN